MVVQGGVQVGVSGAVAAVLVGPAGRPAEDLVAAAVGDCDELLDVDVDQFAGPGAFIAAHGLAVGTVAGGENGQAVPDEDAMGGGGGDTGAVLASQPQNPCLDGGQGAVGLAVRAAGAVLHPGPALLPVAAGPACGGRMADLETFCGPPQRPSVVHDTPCQTQPAGRRQRAWRGLSPVNGAIQEGSDAVITPAVREIISVADTSPCD